MVSLKLNAIFSLLIMLFGCSRATTVNLIPHQLGEKPKKIIWLQIAGFTEEHLAMLRFQMMDGRKKSSFERIMCSGKIWNYNLFELRPSPRNGFLAQITGKKNLDGSCQDFEHRPLWDYLGEQGFSVEIGRAHV